MSPKRMIDVTGLNKKTPDGHHEKHGANNQTIHHHETDYRATLRAKDKAGVTAFGGAKTRARPRGGPDNTSTSSLMSLFHLLNNRVIFPFTPTITIGGQATYEEYSFTHTNYKYNSYDSSSPHDIQIVADFIAQTPREAEYLLAVMHFLRTITKSYFGKKINEEDILPGTPPPVMLFNYMGKYQFNDVPVVVSDYAYVLEPDIDYVEVHGRNTRVPTEIHITLTLKPYYNPKLLRDTFNLEAFKRGDLVTKGFI